MKDLKIAGISMYDYDEYGFDKDFKTMYVRMYVKCSDLPKKLYDIAKKHDIKNGCNYITPDTYVELNGYIDKNKDKYFVNELDIIYFWDSCEVIADVMEWKDIKQSFLDFALKYMDRMPNNSKLFLGDGDYEEIIPQELKDEWDYYKKQNNKRS